MRMSPAEMTAEIDGWLCVVQRSIIRQRTDWQFAMVLAGISQNTEHLHQPQTR